MIRNGMNRATRGAWVAFALLATAACDDDPSGPVVDEGTYRYEVEGDLETTVTGQAWFGAEVDEQGEDIFAVLLGSQDDDHIVVFGVSGTTRPAAGTYQIDTSGEIGAGDWVGLYTVGDGDELVALFVADSGTVVLTESGSDRMEGTFELFMSGIMGSATGEVLLEGEFDARPAPQS